MGNRTCIHGPKVLFPLTKSGRFWVDSGRLREERQLFRIEVRKQLFWELEDIPRQ